MAEQKLRVGASIDAIAAMRDWDAQAARGFRALAQFGWYPDGAWTTGQPEEIARQYEKEPREEADRALCAYVNGRAQSFQETLCSNYPKRARFIRDAFDAHRAGKYTLSVPVMLAQADGICFDTLGEQIYRVKKLAAAVEPLSHKPILALSGRLAALLEQFPIVWGPAERAKYGGNMLNRHVVLHGESLDYDTEKRSCQAITFVNYVGNVMGLVASWKEHT
jgi:hypothetical protein